MATERRLEVPRARKSETATIVLIPWDPDSPEHVERMYQQRVACGWRKEAVESWREQQREGKFALQWVIIPDADPTKELRLSQHTTAWPAEAVPLADTATALAGRPRTPSPSTTFIPVGHIGLKLENPSEGIYGIATFYVSSALQGSGLGRAAMNATEHMAISEPLRAKTLILDTIATEFPGKDDMYRALGISPQKFSNQDWYARRGYKVFAHNDRAYPHIDSTGKQWYAKSFSMRKDIS